MSPNVPARGSARSAVELNEEIRALWLRAGGRLATGAERAEYERLVVEWATAVRAEQTMAEAA
jgi:hypothetical protein